MARQRNEEERKILYQNAAKLFSENGYRGTKINDIARASGVDKTLVQYYYPKKDRFIERMLNNMLNGIRDAAEEAGLHSDDPMVMLYYVGYAHFDFLLHDPQMKRITADIIADRTLTGILIDTELRWVKERFPDAGSPEALEAGVAIAMGGAYELMYRYLAQARPIDIKKLTDSTMVTIMAQMAGPSGEAERILAEVRPTPEIAREITEGLGRRILEETE